MSFLYFGAAAVKYWLVISQIAPVPLLVIHGDDDPVVPFEQGAWIFDHAGEPKTFWRIPGGQHIDSMSREDGRYRGKLLEYLSKLPN